MADTPAPNRQLAQINTVKALLTASKDAIASRLPKHVNADRLLKVALTTINKTPKLMQCTRESLMLSIMQAAELGLEPGGLLGEGYLIPYNVKVKGENGQDRYEMQCQFMPGYRGLISLARRSGQIVSIESHVVHTKDTFKCALGLEPSLNHEPAWEEAEPGGMRFVYAVAKLKDGGTQFEVMSKPQIDGIRKRSKSADSGPWVTDYEEMARKTVIRRLFKYLPVSVELAEALELHGATESGDFIALDGGATDFQLTDGGDSPTAESLMDKLGIAERDRATIRASYAERPADLMEYLLKKTDALRGETGTTVAKEEAKPDPAAGQQTQEQGTKKASGRGKKETPPPAPETKESEPETKTAEPEPQEDEEPQQQPAGAGAQTTLNMNF